MGLQRRPTDTIANKYNNLILHSFLLSLRTLPVTLRRHTTIRQYSQQYDDDANTPHSLVSDRGICAFGVAGNNVQDGVIWIRAEARPTDSPLERLVIRNYRGVTDVTLNHLVISAPHLEYLDITGTSVTHLGIQRFKAARPGCTVISSFDKKKPRYNYH